MSAYDTIVSFIFGTLFGSFANVVADRVPFGKSVLWPGSACARCGRALECWELIPVLSWMFLGGRCHTCREPITVRYPIVELCTGTLYAVTVSTVPVWPERFVWFVFWLIVMAAVGTDWTSMRVPNVVSYGGAAAVVILNITLSVNETVHVVLGAAAGFGLLWFLHVISLGKMGMGDAKLYISIGAMLGPALAVESLVIASVSGTVIGFVLRSLGLLKRREFMPFVPHIAIGVVITAVYGNAVLSWYVHRVLGI